MNYLSLLGNLIAIFHGTFFVFFLLLGTILSVLGIMKKFRWLEVIFVIVIVSTILSFLIFGNCYLTTFEQNLRIQSGEKSYTGGFISHYLGEIGIHVPDIGVFWFLVIFTIVAVISEIYWRRKELKKIFFKS